LFQRRLQGIVSRIQRIGGKDDALGRTVLSCLLHPLCPLPKFGSVLGIVLYPMGQQHADFFKIFHFSLPFFITEFQEYLMLQVGLKPL
jgi:hypothetical protein